MIQRVLIADDDPNVLNGFAEIFRHYGFEVCVAANAAEFETVFFQQGPDLIILDIFFGEDSGPDVYDRVMKLDSSPKTPVVFLTGKLEGIKDSPLVRGRQVAMYTKPIEVSQIIRDIRAAFSSDVAA